MDDDGDHHSAGLQGALERLIRSCVREAAEPIEARVARRDGLRRFETGEYTTADVAADIAECTAQAVRDRCQATGDVGCPIGFMLGAQWIVVTALWLEDIEHRKGRHARLVAASRAQKMFETLPELSRIDEWFAATKCPHGVLAHYRHLIKEPKHAPTADDSSTR
jgi:predicted outer membrane lipoprotein